LATRSVMISIYTDFGLGRACVHRVMFSKDGDKRSVTGFSINDPMDLLPGVAELIPGLADTGNGALIHTIVGAIGEMAIHKNGRTNGSGANLGFESELWRAADALRSNMASAEYKHVVLGLIFLKYISDAFEEQTRGCRPSKTRERTPNIQTNTGRSMCSGCQGKRAGRI